MTPVCRVCWGNVHHPAVNCETCLVAIGKLYARIVTVTTRYDFAAPVDQADLAHVHAELDAVLPAGFTASVTYTPTLAVVGVEVFQTSTRLRRYHRQFRVVVR